jgi:hypothetical protein
MENQQIFNFFVGALLTAGALFITGFATLLLLCLRDKLEDFINNYKTTKKNER